MKRDSAPVSHDVLGIQVTLLNSIKSLRRGERHLQIGLMTKDEAGQVPLRCPSYPRQRTSEHDRFL